MDDLLDIYFRRHPGHLAALPVLACTIQNFPAPWGDPPCAALLFVRNSSTPTQLTVDILPKVLMGEEDAWLRDALDEVDVNTECLCAFKHAKCTGRPYVLVPMEYCTNKDILLGLGQYAVQQGWLYSPDPLRKPWRMILNTAVLDEWTAEEGLLEEYTTAPKPVVAEDAAQHTHEEPELNKQESDREIDKIVEEQNAWARATRFARRSALQRHGHEVRNPIHAVQDAVPEAPAAKVTRRIRQSPKAKKKQMDEEFARLVDATRDQDPKIQETTEETRGKAQRRRQRRVEKNTEEALEIATHLWRSQLRKRSSGP